MHRIDKFFHHVPPPPGAALQTPHSAPRLAPPRARRSPARCAAARRAAPPPPAPRCRPPCLLRVRAVAARSAIVAGSLPGSRNGVRPTACASSVREQHALLLDTTCVLVVVAH